MLQGVGCLFLFSKNRGFSLALVEVLVQAGGAAEFCEFWKSVKKFIEFAKHFAAPPLLEDCGCFGWNSRWCVR